MGTIEFKGEPPFELTVQQIANPIATGGNVRATLLVSDSGAAQAIELQMTMTLEVAQQLVAQLQGPIDAAIKNRWSGR